MSDLYDDMTSGYDDVEARYGFSEEVLPKGWYPLQVVKVHGKDVSKNKVPSARLQVAVTEGAYEKRNAFINIILAPSRLRRDKDGNDLMRTDEEMSKSTNAVKAQVKAWLGAIGVPFGMAMGDGPERMFTFANVDMWEGRQFMGNLGVEVDKTGQYGDRNRLQDCVHLDDAKKGIGVWRSKPQPTVAGTQPSTAGAQRI